MSPTRKPSRDPHPDLAPGLYLLTTGLMIYEVISADPESVTFRTEGFEGVRVVGRAQFLRITKGARVLSSPSAKVRN